VVTDRFSANRELTWPSSLAAILTKGKKSAGRILVIKRRGSQRTLGEKQHAK